tara:strand:+ start:928 stop:1797 length:870 start_codon:yes stop_codon:yes gene_type:complete
MYLNLALSGGILKAVSLIGSLKYLEEIKISRNFKNYIGTSAGGLLLFLYLIGYSADEILQIIKDEIDYLIDINFYNLRNIYSELGIDDSKRFENILRKYLYAKTSLQSISFIEFAKKFGYNLIITGANLDTKKVDYFSVDTFPDMDIVLSLLITSCIPLIFKPIKFNDNLYIDAGVYSNFPIEYFEKNLNDTLGICVISKEIIKNNNLFNYFNNIIYSIMSKLSYDNLNKNKDKYKICFINYIDTNFNDVKFSFNNLKIEINKEYFDIYMNRGYKDFKEYYEKNLLNEN